MADQLAADRQEIVETVHKFCWAIDTAVPLSAFPGTMEAIFTADLQFGLSREPSRNGDGIACQPNGAPGFAAFIEKVQGKHTATHHHCTNTIVTFNDDGARDTRSAFAKTYATNYHFKKDGDRVNYFGCYEDDLVKTTDGWRIQTRRQYPLFVEGKVAPDPPAEGEAAESGSRRQAAAHGGTRRLPEPSQGDVGPAGDGHSPRRRRLRRGLLT